MISKLEEQTNVSRTVLGIILLTSLAVIAFLLWILYIKNPIAGYSNQFLFLPGLNAILNALSLTCLILGVRSIRQGHPRTHMRFVLSACCFTILFLVSYIIHHYLHGNTILENIFLIKIVYFAILFSHLLCATLTLPLVLLTLYLAFTGRFQNHKKIARLTYPAWLYMSSTGIFIYLILKFLG